MGLRLEQNWTWTISAVGLILWMGYLWNFVIEMRTLQVAWPPLLALLLGTGLSVGLVYAGYRFSREDWIDSTKGRRIVAWGIAILLLVSGLRGLTIFIRIAEGRAIAEPGLDLLVSMSGGMIAGVLGGFLHERAKLDAEVAQEMQEAVTFLNETIRHECLNGLMIVQGRVDQVRDELTDDELRQILSVVYSRAQDMTDMIQNVRMFMHTYTGRVDFVAVNLSAILTEEVETLRETHPEAVVTVDIPPNVQVRANKGVKFVIKNILENAVEHNDKDTPDITVTVNSTSDTVSVEIADNGPGIPPTKREKLFEPELDRDHQFGLHLVKTLVTFYDGGIEVSDNEPEGTAVSVDLPRASA